MKSKKICLNKTIFYLGCILLSLVGYLIIDKLSIHFNKEEELIKKEDCICECPIIETPVETEKEKLVIVDRSIEIQNSDSPPQYERGPDRNYTMGGGLPINIRTRGEPGEYQNIGLLKNINPDKPNDVKPLYGRRTYRGSNMWNYYTVLNDHIQVKLPIMRTNNCLDNRGCSEINTGEEISVNNETYKVQLYPYSDFRYIPYIY